MTKFKASMAALFFVSSTSVATGEITAAQANKMVSDFLDSTTCFDAMTASGNSSSPTATIEDQMTALSLSFFLLVHEKESGDELETLFDEFILWCIDDQSRLAADFRRHVK